MCEEFRWPGDAEILAEQAQVDAEGLDRVRAGVQNAGAFVDAFDRSGRRADPIGDDIRGFFRRLR